MKINMMINNVSITLEGNNNEEIMSIMNQLMSMNRPEPSIQNNIRDNFRAHIETVIPQQELMKAPVQNNYKPFIPCSDKQKQLLKSIPEFKGRDLNTVSKSEASNAIEAWNKSRAYHYKDHY